LIQLNNTTVKWFGMSRNVNTIRETIIYKARVDSFNNKTVVYDILAYLCHLHLNLRISCS